MIVEDKTLASLVLIEYSKDRNEYHFCFNDDSDEKSYIDYTIDKIGAIRLLHRTTSLGLKGSKGVVDMLETSASNKIELTGSNTEKMSILLSYLNENKIIYINNIAFTNIQITCRAGEISVLDAHVRMTFPDSNILQMISNYINKK